MPLATKLGDVTTTNAVRVPTQAERPNMVSVGTIVWLSSELMFFAALFAMYFTLRSVNPTVWLEQTEKLNIPFATVNTTVLVLSSCLLYTSDAADD